MNNNNNNKPTARQQYAIHLADLKERNREQSLFWEQEKQRQNALWESECDLRNEEDNKLCVAKKP